MGLDYSYEFVVRRENADLLVSAIADHLAPEDAERIADAKPFNFENPLERVRRDSSFAFGQMCLCFLFPLDPEVSEYHRSSRNELVGGKVRVGCMYSEFVVELNFVIFSATAATTDMSLMFANSRSVRQTMIEIAERSNAELLLLDDEQFDNFAVWPVERRLGWLAAEPSDGGSRYAPLVREAHRLRGLAT